ncbi:MAG: hypothetical protein RR685_09245 [Hungatella sp.]
MRKLWILGLCGMLMLSGCAKKTEVAPESSTEVLIGVPSPMQPVKGSEDFKEIGIFMAAPKQAEQAEYYIIDKTLAEIQFHQDNLKFNYRGAQTEEDITGVYEERKGDPVRESITVLDETTEMTIEMTVQEGRIALWKWNDTHYSLYTPGPIAEADFKKIASELAASSLEAAKHK